ncbi:methyltransferase [Mariniluteicoccus endophyticus]
MSTESQRTTEPSTSQSRGRRRSVAQRALAELLTRGLAGEGEGLRVVDLGGGTGGVSAALAEAGHRVLVVDPSPDALAATARRAAELGLGDRLTGVQGDTTTLAEVAEPGSADVVLCHRVLDRVPGTAEALATMVATLAPGGLLSLLISQRYGQVLKRAVVGDLVGASRTLSDADLLDRPALLGLLAEAGCTVVDEHGIGVLSDQVGDAAHDLDALLRLELACAENPDWLETATQLHVLARRE